VIEGHVAAGVEAMRLTETREGEGGEQSAFFEPVCHRCRPLSVPPYGSLHLLLFSCDALALISSHLR
jgi:hypothetical protein